MEFSDLKIKNIDYTIKYTPSTLQFSAKNRHNHIIGIHLNGLSAHHFHNREFTLSRNTLYFFNQKEDYDVRILEKGLSFSVHFTTYEEIDTPSFCVPIRDASKVLNLLDKIDVSHSAKSRQLNTLTDFYSLCAIIFAQYNKLTEQPDVRMLKAKEYILVHFKEKNCLDGATLDCGITRRRFNDLFKEYFSMTPNDYLTALKINYAKKLLLLNYLSMEDIAEQCGFHNVYYFSKVFKKTVGIPPSHYRKTNQTTTPEISTR